LEYETAIIIGNGAVMNIGDQLHPRGVLDKAGLQVDRRGLRQVNGKEPWCLRAHAVDRHRGVGAARQNPAFRW